MTDNQAVPLPGPATWYGPAGQPCECPNLAGDCDGTHVTDDQAVPLPAVAIPSGHHDLGCQCWPHYGPEIVLAPFGEVVSELKRLERELGRAQGAAAERERIRRFLLDGDPSRLEAALRRELDDEEASDACLIVADLIRARTGDTGD